MACRFRMVAATGLAIFASGCAQKSETTLPAIDASASRDAQGLVVESVYSHGFSAPAGIVRGAGEGAVAGMGDYLQGMSGTYSGEGAVVMLLLTPVILPIAAAVGASAAHSEDEVAAAVATFERVGHDEALLTSLDKRFVGLLGQSGVQGWACVEALSAAAGNPCPGMSPVARLTVYPVFTIRGVGKYDPDIRFHGEVTAKVTLPGAAPDAPERQVLEAKWAYREDLGSFFDLAKDDGALLRARLGAILDRVAAGIVRDLYRDPQPQVIVRTKEFLANRSTTELPEGKLVRIEEGVKE